MANKTYVCKISTDEGDYIVVMNARCYDKVQQAVDDWNAYWNATDQQWLDGKPMGEYVEDYLADNGVIAHIIPDADIKVIC